MSPMTMVSPIRREIMSIVSSPSSSDAFGMPIARSDHPRAYRDRAAKIGLISDRRPDVRRDDGACGGECGRVRVLAERGRRRRQRIEQALGHAHGSFQLMLRLRQGRIRLCGLCFDETVALRGEGYTRLL